MRLLIQRVSAASVNVDGELIGEIGAGMLIFVGIGKDDTEAVVDELAAKVIKLRIFEDAQAKMNLDISQSGGSILVISQFTLYGDLSRGNRPSFTDAAAPNVANELYRRFIAQLAGHLGDSKIAEGRFGAMMEVKLINDGPVTFWVDNCF